MLSIVIPQAFRIILPPLTNELILLTKDSSLVYLLGLTPADRELAKFGRDALNEYVSMTPILVAGLCYLIITVPLGILVRRLEAKPGDGPRMTDGGAHPSRGLRKSFGDVEVLKGIDFEVAPGEVVCVIGPSGSGKSTLLRCVNLLEEPTPGRCSSAGSRSPTPTSTSTRCAGGSAWSSSSSTCSRT